MSLLQFFLINLNLVVFLGLFLLFSKGKRHLHFNRFYLLLAPVAAIALPFMSFKSKTLTGTWVSELPAVTVMKDRSFIGSESMNLESLIFTIGAVLFLAILLFQVYSIVKPKKATFKMHFRGTSVYVLNAPGATHSFFNRIYLNPNQVENEDIILIHEREHCKGFHSIDLITMALYKSIFWFNPAIYYWNKMVKENHEFIADQTVMAEDITAWNYGRILLDENFQSTAPQLTNSFNTKSMLLKRIENLNLKNQYPMKNLLVVPVLAGLTLFSMSMTSEKAPVKQNAAVEVVETAEPDSEAKFPGGQEALAIFLGKEAKYPESLKASNAKGKVFVQFTITAKGKVVDATVLRGSEYEAMNKEALRMISKMPNWKPAVKDGIAVGSKVTMPIVFTM